MSTMSYGIIFWCNSPCSNSIFKIQKIIRIITNAGQRVSCHPLFKNLNILPLYSQYISSVLTFVVKNTDAIKSNLAIHNINTRQGFDLHPPITNLTKAQKAVYYFKFKIFNLSPNIKQVSPKPGKSLTQAKSLRPISLMSFILKLLEKLIDRHIRGGVLVEKPLHQYQYAYRAGMSEETAFSRLLKDWKSV